MANNSGHDKDEEQRTNDGAGDERRRDSGLFNRGRGRGHRMRSSYDRELYQNEIADTSRRGRRRTVSDSDGLHGSYGRGCGPGTDRRGRRKSDQGHRPPYQSTQKGSTKRKVSNFILKRQLYKAGVHNYRARLDNYALLYKAIPVY